MRAAVFEGGRELAIRLVERPRAGAGELVVEVAACGVCGTDVRIVEGRKSRGIRVPSILGHEVSGRVHEVGPGTAGDWSVGEPVVVQPVISCGECSACTAGAENRCERREALGYEHDGGFAELIRIPAAAVVRGNVIRVPDGLDLGVAALAEPLAAVVNGQEQVGVRAGDAVLVLGAGPIGLLHVQLALARGAGPVIVSEPGAARRGAAEALGASVVIDPSVEDVVEATRRATGGGGCDVAIVAIGVAPVAETALAAVRRGGRISLFAGFDPGATVRLDPNRVHYDELVIAGATASGRRQMGEAIELLATGALDGRSIVSDVLPLEQIGEALDLVRTGRGRKILVAP